MTRIRPSVPKWLAAKTFRVEYSPNCASPWLVRLVGYRQGYIDGRSYSPMGLDLTEERLTDDAIGFGKSFAEAAKNALKHYENQKRLAEEQKAKQ